MPAPESLKEVYADEMKDLWSANDQMTRAVTTMAGKAHDPKLKQTLEESVAGIAKHSDALKAMLAETGEEVEKEHCKGMEGLVKEALKHTIKEAQRMASCWTSPSSPNTSACRITASPVLDAPLPTQTLSA